MANQASEVDTAKEIARLNEELRRKEREIKGWKGRASRLERSQSGKKPESSPEGTDSSEAKPAEVAKPHYVGFWQRYCPECGEQNSEFKDETKCDGCGIHLGAIEKAKTLKACPNCGGQKASPIPA